MLFCEWLDLPSYTKPLSWVWQFLHSRKFFYADVNRLRLNLFLKDSWKSSGAFCHCLQYSLIEVFSPPGVWPVTVSYLGKLLIWVQQKWHFKQKVVFFPVLNSRKRTSGGKKRKNNSAHVLIREGYLNLYSLSCALCILHFLILTPRKKMPFFPIKSVCRK